MRIKEDLKLLGSGINFNIYTLSENALTPYFYNKDEQMYIRLLINTYGKSVDPRLHKLVEKNLDKCWIINYEDYPLIGSCNTKNIPIINLAPLKATYLTDFQPVDVYCCFLYTILFSNYVEKRPFSNDLVDQVCLFYFNVFMNMYGKKAGLTGSPELVNKLRYLVYMYTYSGIFGIELTKNIKNKVSSFLFTNQDRLKLDYDFSNIIEFLKCIKDNGIIAISENKFATDAIKIDGIESLPMYEDISRLFATLVATTIKGNSVFSNYWAKKSKTIYDKMVYYGMHNIKY